MKETETTYYCDVTGEEIENQFDMIAVDVDRGSSGLQYTDRNESIHIGPDTHDMDPGYDPMSDDDITAIVSDGDVIGLKISSGMRSYYVGPETDGPYTHLIPLIQEAIDDG
jgi:hypothetical protein